MTLVSIGVVALSFGSPSSGFHKEFTTQRPVQVKQQTVRDLVIYHFTTALRSHFKQLKFENHLLHESDTFDSATTSLAYYLTSSD